MTQRDAVCGCVCKRFQWKETAEMAIDFKKAGFRLTVAGKQRREEATRDAGRHARRHRRDDALVRAARLCAEQEVWNPASSPLRTCTVVFTKQPHRRWIISRKPKYDDMIDRFNTLMDIFHTRGNLRYAAFCCLAVARFANSPSDNRCGMPPHPHIAPHQPPDTHTHWPLQLREGAERREWGGSGIHQQRTRVLPCRD